MRKNKTFANCVVCGTEFVQIDSRHLCCCRRCREKYKNLKKGTRICAYCGEEYISEYNTQFCSKECKEKYKRDNYPKKETICKQCGKPFIGLSYQKFCCSSCKTKYGYEHSKVKTTCCVCGKEICISKYELKDRNFCSHECVMAWEVKNNLVKSTETKPHKKVMEYMDANNISYEKEKGCGRFRIDVCVGNVAFEVNGTYWHADPRFYKDEDLDERQKYGKEKDVRKKAYLESQGYKVIYLWEYDINNNFDLIKSIIQKECPERLNEKTDKTDAIV